MATKVADTQKEVRELREALGLSQEALAQLLGVSTRTVSRWECGTSELHPLAVKELRRWLRVLDRLKEVVKPSVLPRWFNQSNEALGGRSPFEVACSPYGDDELLDLLGQIEWGIPG